MRFKNTGDVNWAFGVRIEIRKPDGTTVVTTSTLGKGANAGETVVQAWLSPVYDVPGSWDIRAIVFREFSNPTNILADSGWVENYITVTVNPPDR